MKLRARVTTERKANVIATENGYKGKNNIYNEFKCHRNFLRNNDVNKESFCITSVWSILMYRKFIN